MTHTWDAWGKTIPLTVLQLPDNIVVEQRTKDLHNVNAIVVGANEVTKPWKLLKSTRGFFDSKGVPYKKDLQQFKVTDPSLLPVGTSIGADHFVPGQYVDVISTTIGKSFAGVMKRWGMAGGNASHGATKSHRRIGSNGGAIGRVWKGKKMAGHMGVDRRITHSLEVYKIDTRWNVIYLKGSVSGPPGTVVTVSDARRKTHKEHPPYPTASAGQVPDGVHIVQPTEEDPGEKMRG
jgi:large subunit ribosomal protein L3